MSTMGKVEVLILWDEEIRIAAKALKRFHDMTTDVSASNEDMRDAATSMYRACYAALDGAWDESRACVVVKASGFKTDEKEQA